MELHRHIRLHISMGEGGIPRNLGSIGFGFGRAAVELTELMIMMMIYTYQNVSHGTGLLYYTEIKKSDGNFVWVQL